MLRHLSLLLITLSIFCSSCIQRPKKRDDLVYHNTYKTVRTLIVESEKRKTEGWIDVQEKDVERKFGLKDTLYIVHSKDKIVGYITADHKAYRLEFRNPPYELDKVDTKPIEQYVGTWRTMETAVQNILGLYYPVTIH